MLEKKPFYPNILPLNLIIASAEGKEEEEEPATTQHHQ